MDRPHVTLLLILIALSLDTLTNGLLAPVLLDMLGYQNIATVRIDSALAFLMSLSPAYFFVTPIVAAYSDYRQRKPAIIFCLCSAYISYCLCLLAHAVALKIIVLFAIT